MFNSISQSKSKHSTLSNRCLQQKMQHSTAIMIFEITNMHAHLLYEMEIQLKLPILTLLSATSPTILTPNARICTFYIYRNLINSITFFASLICHSRMLCALLLILRTFPNAAHKFPLLNEIQIILHKYVQFNTTFIFFYLKQKRHWLI